jgi:hypothetical protein
MKNDQLALITFCIISMHPLLEHSSSQVYQTFFRDQLALIILRIDWLTPVRFRRTKIRHSSNHPISVPQIDLSLQISFTLDQPF